MLGFFSAKSNHPLADAKELRLTLEQIAVHEPQAALDETLAWLESLSSADDIKLEQLLDLILRLDEATLPQTRRLGREYVTAQRLDRAQEFRLWNCNFSYWMHLVQAYEQCLKRYASGEKGASNINASLALLYARQIHAYGACLKWNQLRYGPQNSDLWLGIGRVYLAATAACLEQKRFVLYPGGAETSVEQEYLKTLVLHASSLDKLRPLEVELADYLIPYLLPTFQFTHEARPENIYWVDAGKPLPPTRLAKLPEMTKTLRFIAVGKTVEVLEGICRRIESTGQVPAELNLGGAYPVSVVLVVLAHLMRYWMTTPPMRNHSRHRVTSHLKVIYGLARIHASLSNELTALSETTEEWIVDDVSMGGMGAQVQLGQQGANDWVRVGALVGVQPEGGDNWLIAVVRRFSRDSERQGSVGIETIGKLPCAILADCSGLSTEVLLLEPLDHTVNAQSLPVVLSNAAFEEGIPLRFTYEGRQLRLHAQTLVERGIDFAVARYQVEWVA